jgi:2-amino-4-hydroxy-6-hydroxymethyldihydropteridine diphosphokinase
LRRAFILLGSNIAPRDSLARATAALLDRFHVVARSPVYLTAPVGDREQDDFWNLAVEVESDGDPESLQAELHAIEDRLGRQRDPARPNGPRTVDLDLVFVEGLYGRFGGLELPSPLLAHEAFAAVPLADLAGDLRHPSLGIDLAELARRNAAAAARPPRRLAVEVAG